MVLSFTGSSQRNRDGNSDVGEPGPEPPMATSVSSKSLSVRTPVSARTASTLLTLSMAPSQMNSLTLYLALSASMTEASATESDTIAMTEPSRGATL